MSDCCCTLDCSLVCEDVIDIISLKEPEINASSLDGVIIAHQIYTGVDTNDIQMNVDNENYTISATLVPFEWLTYTSEDWIQAGNYYTLTIPFASHKCLNSYVAEMMLKVGDDYENVLRPTYKRLANDSIFIRSDIPVDFKILIKGDR